MELDRVETGCLRGVGMCHFIALLDGQTWLQALKADYLHLLLYVMSILHTKLHSLVHIIFLSDCCLLLNCRCQLFVER